MKSYCYALLIAAFATHQSEAFSVSSRKAFLSKATATAGAAIIATTPMSASAGDGVAQRLLKQKQADNKARKAAETASSESDGGFGDGDGPSSGKAGSNATFRGGKEQADKIALGTELNKGQENVANGLMDKLGL